MAGRSRSVSTGRRAARGAGHHGRPAPDDLRARIVKRIEEKTGNIMNLTESVNPDIVGGLVLPAWAVHHGRLGPSPHRRAARDPPSHAGRRWPPRHPGGQHIRPEQRKVATQMNSDPTRSPRSSGTRCGHTAAPWRSRRSAPSSRSATGSPTSTASSPACPRDPRVSAQGHGPRAEPGGQRRRVLLGDDILISEGDGPAPGKVIQVPVGEALLGRVVDPARRPARRPRPDRSGTLHPGRVRGAGRRPAPAGEGAAPDQHHSHRLDDSDRPRPARADHRRSPDRQVRHRRGTRSSTRRARASCVYVAIGQKASKVAQVVGGSLGGDGVHVGDRRRSQSAPLQYLAPYSAAAMGEYFM